MEALVNTSGRRSNWFHRVRSGLPSVLEISCFQHLVYALSLTLIPTHGNLQVSTAGLDEESAKCVCTYMCWVSHFLLGKSWGDCMCCIYHRCRPLLVTSSLCACSVSELWALQTDVFLMSASIRKILYGEVKILLMNVYYAFQSLPVCSSVSFCFLSLTLPVLSVTCYVITEVIWTSVTLNAY